MKRNLFFIVPAILLLCFSTLNAQGQLNIHGFVSQGYLKSTENNYLIDSKTGSYEFNEAAINFMMPVSNNLQMGLQFLARDFGEEGNHTALLDWAYGDYNWNPSLGVRAGKIKVPHGLYNQGRDIDLLRTPILLPQGVYDETMRDFSLAMLGSSIYGNAELPWIGGDVDYEVIGGTLSIPNAESAYWKWVVDDIIKGVQGVFIPLGTTIQITDQNVKGKSLYGGALQLNTPLEGLKVGVSMIKGKLDVNTDMIMTVPVADLSILSPALKGVPLQYQENSNLKIDVSINEFNTYSAQYTSGSMTVSAEYHRHEYRTDIKLGPQGLDLIWKSEGYFGQLNYRFTDWLELCCYYSEFYPNREDKVGKTYSNDYEAWQKDLSFTARFDMTSHWLMKLEVHRMDGAAQVYSFSNPDGRERYWQLFALKTTYNF